MTGTRSDRGPRVRRDCQHRFAKHQHGTPTAYKLDRCRCDPCTDAAADAERRRRLDLHIGAAPRLIDATEVREHVRALGAQGVGYKQVAHLAGVAPSTVAKIINRDPGRADGRPQQRVTPSVAERILHIRATLDTVTDGASIDATGTARRLQALHARGWSRRTLAARLSVEHNALRALFVTGTVSGRLARAVRALYDDLWNLAPPAVTPHDRASVTRTIAWAQRNHWLVPAAWDDDTIDDPTAEPATTETVQASARDRLDELLFLARAGTGLQEAARRVGYGSWPIAQRIAQRHDHPAARLAERLELEHAA